MKNYKILLLASFAAATLVSCSQKAVVKGTLVDAPEKDVVVKVLEGGVQMPLDSLRTDKAGAFKATIKLKKGDPRFVYFYYGDTKFASLLLDASDKVVVEADTLGHWTVSGSQDCALLQQVEKDYTDFIAEMNASLESALANPAVTEKDINAELSKEYVAYHRKAVRFVVANPKSLIVIPVLYQKVNDEFPVFNRPQDAIYFRSAADSLATVYPASTYVKMLEKEAEKRENALSLGMKMQSANQLGYPDVELPDVNGQKAALSGVVENSKVVMVLFWNADDAAQKMFNIDKLLPLYNKYHAKGFDVYSVNIGTDKVDWGTSVRKQQLPWTNVCDGLGAASPVLLKYNIASLPTFYVIVNGEILSDSTDGLEGLEKLLKKYC